ncbi:MAG: glucuronate isomerase [Planctomycetota bacterium]|nr:glucuronate isomerase [Planctomycetota bacterium]
MIQDISLLRKVVRKAVETTTVTDIHTHLSPPSHGDMLLWGVDEVLTYHYLVAELFIVASRDLTYEKFFSLPRSVQADLVWEHLFLKRGALSEATRGAITTFNRLGLDVAGRDLAGIRKWFAEQDVEEYLSKVFTLANIYYAVMTNSPFSAAQVELWNQSLPVPACLRTSLRIDMLFGDGWERAAGVMAGAGYAVRTEPDEKTFDEVRRFLVDWSARLNPVYFAASIGPEFAYGDDSAFTRLVDRSVVPAAIEVGVPFALMIGARRAVNPNLRDAGAGVGVADVTAINALLLKHPDAKFLVTMLSRNNQHELTVLARKFRNLHLFGCWWFCNNPSIINEMTRQRLELLGTAFTCQHSDARVLDQLIYKWDHTRKIVADILVEKYSDLFEAGWRPAEEEIARDARAIFGGSFEEFLNK